MKMKHHLRAVLFVVFLVVVVAGSTLAKQRELEYWTMFSQGEPLAEGWLVPVIKEFEEATGIKVNIVWAGREVVTRVRPRILTGNMPDIIEQSNAEILALVEEGLAYPMDEALETKAWDRDVKWGETFSPLILELNRFNDEIHMIPRSTYTSGFFYNESMFEDLGLTPPKTWTEFLEVCETLKQNGITPLSADGTISWYNVWYFSWLAMRTAGPEKLKAAAEGKISWNDPDFLRAAQMVRELIDNDYFIKGYEGSVFPASQMEWVQGNTGMLLCGAWIPSEMSKTKPEDFRMNLFAFPEVEDSAVDQSIAEAWSNSWLVLKGGKNTEEAIEFLKFITSVDAANKHAALLAPTPVLDTNPVQGLEEQANIFERASEIVHKMAGLETMHEYYHVVYQTVGDKLFLGRISPEEFINEMEEATQEFYARRK